MKAIGEANRGLKQFFPVQWSLPIGPVLPGFGVVEVSPSFTLTPATDALDAAKVITGGTGSFLHSHPSMNSGIYSYTIALLTTLP